MVSTVLFIWLAFSLPFRWIYFLSLKQLLILVGIRDAPFLQLSYILLDNLLSFITLVIGTALLWKLWRQKDRSKSWIRWFALVGFGTEIIRFSMLILYSSNEQMAQILDNLHSYFLINALIYFVILIWNEQQTTQPAKILSPRAAIGSTVTTSQRSSAASLATVICLILMPFLLLSGLSRTWSMPSAIDSIIGWLELGLSMACGLVAAHTYGSTQMRSKLVTTFIILVVLFIVGSIVAYSDPFMTAFQLTY